MGGFFRKNLKINISFKLLHLRLPQILSIFMPSIGCFRTYLISLLIIRTIVLNLALIYYAISPISVILASTFPLSTIAITSMTSAVISLPTSVLSISTALSPTGAYQKNCRPGLGTKLVSVLVTSRFSDIPNTRNSQNSGPNKFICYFLRILAIILFFFVLICILPGKG